MASLLSQFWHVMISPIYSGDLQRWRGCAATIEKDENDEVYGVLWELNNSHLSTLDNQEGVHKNVYRRFEIQVKILRF